MLTSINFFFDYLLYQYIAILSSNNNFLLIGYYNINNNIYYNDKYVIRFNFKYNLIINYI